ncbi:spermidine/putrescine ABC transporter permease PotB [Maridesulfovibrio sp.]|uniref:spermidine/putrescine ABC transporter permease PotB n=1 Tax=Maridesulfovibrio sp. TaxID=2795000 RepID=UPI0029CA6391|nr:spermidine/putrescine ABC transporter permease PotB [Maridesulfovibrio sp.]
MKNKKDSRLFASGTIWIWLILLVLLPNLLVLGVSFLTVDTDRFVSLPFTFSNYLELLDPAVLKIFQRSFKLAAMTTLICLFAGYPFAWFLARVSKKLRPLLLVLVIVPFWTNSLVRTYALVAIINANGLINKLLKTLGIIDMPLQMLYTPGAVLLGLSYTLLPFMVLPLYSSIIKIDTRLMEAGRDLGGSPMSCFFRIALPLTMPGIVSGCMLVFLPALGMFYIPDIMGGSKQALIGNFIRDQFLVSREWPVGAAASVLMILLMAVMFGLQRFSRRKVSRRKA